MSAYGPSQPRSTNAPILETQFLKLKLKDGTKPFSESEYSIQTSEHAHLAVYHLTAHTIPPELAAYLYEIFQEELESGMTYPQEYPMSRSGFDTYFLGNDLFVGVLTGNTQTDDCCSIEQVRNGREWNDCVGGTYYVSHLNVYPVYKIA